MAGLRIRPETAADHAAIRAVVAAAFVRHQEVAEIVELIRESAQFVPELSLVAVDDDDDDDDALDYNEVVGYVMLSHLDVVDDDVVAHQVVMLSPLAVMPSRQGRGIGGALIRAGSPPPTNGEPLVILEGGTVITTDVFNKCETSPTQSLVTA